jgi:hypothetical protein
MNALAFALGLVVFGLVKADVSHLKTQQHTFVANNGQYVKQSFNNNGDATFNSQPFSAGNNPNSNSRYWWMNTQKETLPFTKTQNYFSAAGCNGCASRTLNIRHNTQHATQHHSQNHFTNVKSNASPFNGIQRQTASVSGSPNGFYVQPSSSFDSGRIQQSSSCSDSNSACVAPKFCFNGFIDQSAAQKATRSAVSLSCCFYFSFFNTFEICAGHKMRHKFHPTLKTPFVGIFSLNSRQLMSNKTIKVDEKVRPENDSQL